MQIKVNKILSYQTLVYKNGNRTFRKKKYNDYIQEIGNQLADETYKGDVAIKIIFKCKNRVVGDIDNITKPVLDTLQSYGVIENDKFVQELHLQKKYGFKYNQIDIYISQPQEWLDKEG